MADIRQLNERFGIAGAVEVRAERGGLPAVVVLGAEGKAGGTVYLHGGHVASWKPVGVEEALWLSKESAWEGGKPIRGGVPLVFPWFGPRANAPAGVASPAHGFVRLVEWELEAVTREAEGVAVVLVTRSDAATRASWPGEFEMRHRVTLGRELTMRLEVKNTGKEAWTMEEAQHTYFGVGDVRKVRVGGLDGVKYIDKGNGMVEKVQEGDVTITAETDRIYVETTGEVTISDPVLQRRIRVRKENSKTTVVWNPWVGKAKAMPDFGDEEWMGMICVETCNVLSHGVKVGPGEAHVMGTRVMVENGDE